MKKLIIIGIGETAEIAYEYFTRDSDYQVMGFSVDACYKTKKTFCSLPVESFEHVEKKYPIDQYSAFIAAGSGKLNSIRQSLYKQTKNKGYTIASYVSSNAFVWHNVIIGENCFVFENNTLQPNVVIGNNVTIWSGNHIGHRTNVMDNCFISSHVVVSGFCEIGCNTFIGVNASFADNIKVADNNFIAMGSVVTKNTSENSVYRGNPAKRMRISAKKLCGIRS